MITAAFILLVCLLVLRTARGAAEVPSLAGRVIEIEVFGHARLSISVSDFMNAGFTPGDTVSVRAGIYAGDMPFFDGYYAEKGECMVRALPGEDRIAVCVNYGRFAETAGIDIGDQVVLTLKEKAGARVRQEINSLVYSDRREDYGSDECFGNFRPVAMGKIGKGRLYRSASPINNEHGRSACVNTLVQAAEIRTILNMGDTYLEILAHSVGKDFDSAYYLELFRNGSVLAMGMPIDYTSDEFIRKMVSGLTFLAEREPPYLLHCNEGKDRTGFIAMVLEALMGSDRSGIEKDYLLSYENYYHLNPEKEKEKTRMILERNVREMLRTVAGTGKGTLPEQPELAAAAENYLLKSGMDRGTLNLLRNKLL